MKPNVIKKIKNKINHLWKNVVTYFYYTGKPLAINPISYLRSISDRSGEDEFKNIDNGALYELVKELREKSGSTGCEYADLVNLVNDKKLNDCFISLNQRVGTLWQLNKLIPQLNLKYSVIKRQSTAFLKA